MKRYLTGIFASLRTRNYRLYFFGQSVSLAGTWMQKMAQAWLVLELTNSGDVARHHARRAAVAVAPSRAVGRLARGPHEQAHHSDRHRDRRDGPSLLLGVLILTNHVNVGLVLGLAVIGGLIDALDKPARQSFPSEMVSASHLANAVMLNNVIQDTGKVVGPAIAGVLIAAVGLPYTFFLNALSFLAVVAGLLLMRTEELSVTVPLARGAGQVRAGLAYVRATPQLLGPLALLGSVGLVAYNFQLLLALLGRETFHGDARTVGYLLGALGAGSVIGGLALAGVLRASVGRIIGAATVLAVLFVATGLSPTLAVAFGMVFALGAASVLFKATASTWLQLTAAPEMRGRVLALLVVAIAGTTPIGAPLMGWVAEHFGVRPTFVLAGVLTAVAAALAYAYLRRTTDERETATSHHSSLSRAR